MQYLLHVLSSCTHFTVYKSGFTISLYFITVMFVQFCLAIWVMVTFAKLNGHKAHLYAFILDFCEISNCLAEGGFLVGFSSFL